LAFRNPFLAGKRNLLAVAVALDEADDALLCGGWKLRPAAEITTRIKPAPSHDLPCRKPPRSDDPDRFRPVRNRWTVWKPSTLTKSFKRAGGNFARRGDTVAAVDDVA
jgi:hypothetical protein